MQYFGLRFTFSPVSRQKLAREVSQVYTCPKQGYFWDGSSLGGTFRRAVLRRLAPVLLSVIDGLWVTPLAVPLAVPLLQGFGTGQGNSRAAPPAHGASQPALRESLRLRNERGSGRHLEMGRSCSFVSNLMRQWTESPRYSSTAAAVWKLAPPIASYS